MPRGDESLDLMFSDRDDDAEDLGYGGGSGGGGGASYDDDEEEDGGWAINKDQTEDLWDSAEDSDDEEEAEEGGATETEGEEEDSDAFAPRPGGRGAGAGSVRRGVRADRAGGGLRPRAQGDPP